MRSIGSVISILALLCFIQTPTQAQDLTEKEQQALKPMEDAINQVLSATLKEVEDRAKKNEKDGPRLLKEESKPRIGYHVYSDRSHRSHYHDGKMVRADRRASKELKDLIVKMCGQPTRGPRFEWMQVPDREARERWHWNLTTIVTQGDAQVPWKYTCEFTIHKNGDVTVSVMDTDRAEALAKVVADK